MILQVILMPSGFIFYMGYQETLILFHWLKNEGDSLEYDKWKNQWKVTLKPNLKTWLWETYNDKVFLSTFGSEERDLSSWDGP